MSGSLEWSVATPSGRLLHSRPSWSDTVAHKFLSRGAEWARLSHEALSLHPMSHGFHLVQEILSFEDLTREESFWESDLVCYSMVLAEKDVSSGD